jgi:hypothetical protein
MKKLCKLLGIISVGTVIAITLAGCTNPTGIVINKPVQLTNNSTESEVLAALDDLIAYPETPPETRAQAQEIKNNWSIYASIWISNPTIIINNINNLINAIPEEEGGGGGVIDSALVATWHSTQKAADDGTSVAFEFEADGNFIVSGMQSGTSARATTSGGRISAVLTASGYDIGWGSADYAVSGTTLRFSNFSTGYNYFQILQDGVNTFYEALNETFPGQYPPPYYYYKAGNNSGDTTAPTLTNVSVTNGAPDKLILTFDEPVTANNVSGWSLQGATISGNVIGRGSMIWIIPLNESVSAGQSLTISYSASAGSTRDMAGNVLGNIASFEVTKDRKSVV